MPYIDREEHSRLKAYAGSLQTEGESWRPIWRELAENFLPRRYAYLYDMSPGETAQANLQRSRNILDSTGTIAMKTLASGLMNGITSPSRHWLKIKVVDIPTDEEPHELRVWLDEVERKMLTVMGMSNFYNGMARVYQDLALFGTAAMLIYEDDDSIIRVHNPPVGQYVLAQSSRMAVNTFVRCFYMTPLQLREQFPYEYLSDDVKSALKDSGNAVNMQRKIMHMIEPNDPPAYGVPRNMAYRDLYWEDAGSEGTLLAAKGFNEMPGIFPRWETMANDPYGSSPAFDALGDVIQLQHETKSKGQALDLMLRPPMQADIQLKTQVTALTPRGITYVPGLANNPHGLIRPVYQVQPPIAEITADIAAKQNQIRVVFHNDLFNMIANIETVRSATEIAERVQEKLVQLGPMLERFEDEALDPAFDRIFEIMSRRGLLPPPPPQFRGLDVEAEYVSILSLAQKAAATAPSERFIEVIGASAQMWPQAPMVVDWPEFLSSYGQGIGVPAKTLKPLEQVRKEVEAQNRAANEQQQVEQSQVASQTAANIAKVDPGGGLEAARILGGP